MFSGRVLCDELINRPEESYRLWCVVVYDLETSTYKVQRISQKHNSLLYKMLFSTLSRSFSGPLKYRSKVNDVYSALLTLDLNFIGPEDDSERVQTCRPKIAFYILNWCVFD